MCVLFTRPLNHSAIEGHIYFYNIPILELLLLMLCEYYMNSLTFLYRSRGKGRRWRFGAHHRYFSIHHRWGRLSFHSGVGGNRAPAHRRSTSVFFYGSLGYDRMLVPFRGHRFCWAREKTGKWYCNRKPHFLQAILRVIEMQDTYHQISAALCRWPACCLHGNIAISLNHELWKHYNKLPMPSANTLKNCMVLRICN